MRITKGLVKVLLFVLTLVPAVLLPRPASPAEITLCWDPPMTSPAGEVAGYKIYYGRTPHNYKYSVSVGTTTSFTVQGLAGGSYYFAVTSVDGLGNESDYSNEVSRTFEDDQSPVIFSLSVGRGIEGTPVTVSGVNFGAKKGAVYVGERKAKVIQWSAAGDSATFISPKRLPYETYEVGVVTAGRTRSGNVLAYQVMQANITGASANSGAPGDLITLTGEYLGPKPKVYLSYTVAGKAVRKAAKVTVYSVTDSLNSAVEFKLPGLETGKYVLNVVNSQGMSNGWDFEVR